MKMVDPADLINGKLPAQCPDDHDERLATVASKTPLEYDVPRERSRKNLQAVRIVKRHRRKLSAFWS